MGEPDIIPSSEFLQNYGRYGNLVEHQDFQVAKNGRAVGLEANTHRDRLNLVDKLSGSIHAVIDEKADHDERIGSS